LPERETGRSRKKEKFSRYTLSGYGIKSLLFNNKKHPTWNTLGKVVW
jgi:hypothetical protein